MQPAVNSIRDLIEELLSDLRHRTSMTGDCQKYVTMILMLNSALWLNYYGSVGTIVGPH